MTRKKIFVFGSGGFMKEILGQILKTPSLELLGIVTDRTPKCGGRNCDYAEYFKGTDPYAVEGYKPDAVLLLEYRKIVPADLVKKFSFINSHSSLLPDWRGFHNLGWAFLNKETEVGYTIHLAEEHFDSGDILYQHRIPLTKEMTFNDLKETLGTHLRENYLRVVLEYLDGKIKPQKQAKGPARYVGHRNLRDCYIDWDQPSEDIEYLIRAMSPPAAPGAFTICRGKKLILLDAEIHACREYTEIPGHVVNIEGDRILIKTKDTCIWTSRVIFEDKEQKASEAVSVIGTRLGVDLIEMYLKNMEMI